MLLVYVRETEDTSGGMCSHRVNEKILLACAMLWMEHEGQFSRAA